jgi:hypothetical protein
MESATSKVSMQRESSTLTEIPDVGQPIVTLEIGIQEIEIEPAAVESSGLERPLPGKLSRKKSAAKIKIGAGTGLKPSSPEQKVAKRKESRQDLRKQPDEVRFVDLVKQNRKCLDSAELVRRKVFSSQYLLTAAAVSGGLEESYSESEGEYSNIGWVEGS